MSLIVAFSPPNLIMSPPHCAFSCALQSHARLATCRAATAADGRRAQTADRRYAIAYQTVPPTPPEATTPALLPSRNQRPRRLFFSLLAGRRVYGEAVQVERGAG